MRKWGVSQQRSIPIHIHSGHEPEDRAPKHQGLGSSSSSLTWPSATPFNTAFRYQDRQDEETDYNSWHSFTTGRSASSLTHQESIRESAPRFVKATALSLTVDQLEDRRRGTESQRSKSLGQSLDSIVTSIKGKELAGEYDPQNEVLAEAPSGGLVETGFSAICAPSEMPDPVPKTRTVETEPEPRKSGFSLFYESFKKELSSRPQSFNTSEALTAASMSDSQHRKGPPSRTFELKRKREPEGRGLLSSRRSQEDWFISKAQEAMRIQREKDGVQRSLVGLDVPERSSSEHTLNNTSERAPSSGDRGEYFCPICTGALPMPLTPEAQADHTRSLGHRLALDSSKPLPAHPAPILSSGKAASSGDVKPKTKGNDLERFRLRDDNKGYGLLAKMGWKEGMGLGREEDETERIDHPEVNTKIKSPSLPDDAQEVKPGSNSQNAIVLGEESDSGSGNANVDREDSMTWEEIASSAEVSRKPSRSQAAKSSVIPKSNRAINPIPIQLKNNRLGLGATSKSYQATLLTGDEDEETSRTVARSKNFTPVRKIELKRQRKSGERLEGDSKEDRKVKEGKRQRKEREEREKREWRALRESLG